MRNGGTDDLSGLSMLELFRVEVENQTAILTSSLLELERDPGAAPHLEALMRAAHSLKGAARIVNQDHAVRLAHAIEDCFVAAQHGKITLGEREIDLLFQGVDLLQRIARQSGQEKADAESNTAGNIQNYLSALAEITGDPRTSSAATPNGTRSPSSPEDVSASESSPDLPVVRKNEHPDRVLRLRAENLNRLLGLAGESLVESRWLHPFAGSMFRLKRMQSDLSQTLQGLRESLEECDLSEQADGRLKEAIDQIVECRQFLSERLVDLEMFDRRSANLSHRLYAEVLQCRMRPFGDGIRRFPRMVRDLARSLGKKIRLDIVGENTRVDRDLLDKLEAPLAHLIRNAVDHGSETPEERRRAGKPEECVVKLEARHGAGMLVVTVADDGAGIYPEHLRETIVRKKVSAPGVVEKLSEPELLEFLLLPGFTMRDTVTEISGRGVGLDVVQNMVKSVRGNIRISTQPGKGMRFQLQLPLTLSVLRALLVEVADEPYAIPLSQISRTMKLPRNKIQALAGRHHFALGDQQVGLLTAHQLFDHGEFEIGGEELPVVILGDRNARYGLVVDRLLGERELVVQALDPRLGKVKDISAASLMEDGSPVLIVDMDDMLRSIEKLVSEGQLNQVQRQVEAPARRCKRILAVDDSPTVRELERELLSDHGYEVEVAVDGMDGWNAVRGGRYDLVILDVDMPRMDGIELATLIKQDQHLSSLAVIIVSYKDREEDRLRGLEAGADYYLTKDSFQDETLLQAVRDLIGQAQS
jgi:two-component system sensor histidine kinase and response regulator WspE